VISLGKRAEDEEKPFFETIAPGRSTQAIAGRDRKEGDYIQFHKDRRDENGQRFGCTQWASVATS
jgi:hypothetical protein